VRVKSFHNAAAMSQVVESGLHKQIWWRPSREVYYRFSGHYHPFTDELIEKLNRDGLAALLDPDYHASLRRALAPDRYQPAPHVTAPFPVEEIDVSDDGAYAIYNWELFFHAPVLVATHLSKNQRFAEAQKWFHHVFDPTSTADEPAPERFWRFLRFRQETSPTFAGDLLAQLSAAGESDVKRRVEKAIQAWRDKPFQPHVVARGRFLAYQLNVVMKYLDNLIAWGDFLFRQDTMETLNEATQLYVLAANVLGPKPQRTPPRTRRTPKSYRQLKDAGIDAFGNALVELENAIPFNAAPSGNGGDPGASGVQSVFGITRSLYFAIPPNDVLLGYWDRVEDRLFKIRHCLNIEGVVRQLALFDPPIDPGALVKAAAAGIDMGSVVANLNQPVSTIRGPLLLQKAQELCAEVKALGAAVLAAREKGEAEHVALMRQQHEVDLHELGRDVRFLQWKEAEAATEALLHSRATVWERYRHYKRILGATDTEVDALKAVDLARLELNEKTFDEVYAQLVARHGSALPREAYRKETSVGGLTEFAGEKLVTALGGELGRTLPLNKNENAELNVFLPASDRLDLIASALNLIAPVLAHIPQFGTYGAPLGVGGSVEFGGRQLAGAAKYGAEQAAHIAGMFRTSADRASRMASYYRRAEDYVLQANLATAELEQYGRQIVASLLREQILRREYENQLAQIEQANALEAFMRDKFTDEKLYSWMEGELSRTHYDTYKLAFEVAKRAEQTLKHELMRPEFDELNIVKFGYWDGGHKGLLAGEALGLDLKRLELAYLEHNRREYELTRHVSLARLDPMALLRLKATGTCEVTVPEWLFDLDSPGQYMRRLKTVALSIPAVTGPYTGVHCKLSLLRSSVRTSSLLGDQYARDESVEDGRFRDFSGAITSIVTSSGQNDSGLFEVSLRDERYLPFEGAGAEGTWRIELPNDVPQFDFESIADVVLHLRYTAREAGHLRAAAAAHVKQDVLEAPEGLLQLFTVNHDFPGPWSGFANAADDPSRRLQLTITQDHFPYWVSRLGIGDQLAATFAVIDRQKNKLTIAPASVDLSGPDATEGWTLSLDQASAPVFGFLKRNRDAKVYMAVSYTARS
jgi:Tc toxin complex TcA C-terminal TcB-binding domain